MERALQLPATRRSAHTCVRLLRRSSSSAVSVNSGEPGIHALPGAGWRFRSLGRRRHKQSAPLCIHLKVRAHTMLALLRFSFNLFTASHFAAGIQWPCCSSVRGLEGRLCLEKMACLSLM